MQKSKFKRQKYNSKVKSEECHRERVSGSTFAFLLAFLTFNFLLLSFPNPVSAHVLKSDGSVGAVIHIDPEDDPIAGQETGFYFEFKDKQNKFKAENCDCTFSVMAGGEEIFTQPLFQDNSPSLSNASVSYTFPRRDVYQVTVKGKPQTSNTFQPFTLTWDIRVERTVENTTSENTSSGWNTWIITHIPHIVGGILASSFFLWVVMRKRPKKTEK